MDSFLARRENCQDSERGLPDTVWHLRWEDNTTGAEMGLLRQPELVHLFERKFTEHFVERITLSKVPCEELLKHLPLD